MVELRYSQWCKSASDSFRLHAKSFWVKFRYPRWGQGSVRQMNGGCRHPVCNSLLAIADDKSTSSNI